MKPTKIRNYQIYQAPLHRRSKQLGSTLSKEIRKKYGKRNIRVVEGDTVKVMRGEYRDVEGKVASVSTLYNSVAIEGIKKEKGKGDKVDVLIHTSNLMITSLNTDDGWRVSKLEGKEKKGKTQKPAEQVSESKQDKKEEPKKIVKEAKSEKPKKENLSKKQVQKNRRKITNG